MKLQNKLKHKLINILKTRKQGLEFLFYNVSGNVFTFLLNFILPFFITTEGYGYFALIFSIFNLGAAFFTFGLDATIIKFSIEKKNYKNILLTSLLSWFLLAAISLIVLIFISYFIAEYNILALSFYPLIQVIIASAFISIQRIVLAFYIGVEAIRKYGLLFSINKVIQFLIILLAAIFFENVFFLKILPYLLLVQSIIVLITIFFMERKKLLEKMGSKADILNISKFTLPLSINTLGNFGYSYGFNVFVSPFLSLSQLGILNIFTQLSSIASMTINALNNGYIPRFYRNFSDKPKRAILNYFKYIGQNSFPILLIVFVIGFIYKFLSFRFVEDYSILALAVYCLGIFLYSFKSIGSNILIIKGKTMKTSMITIITSGINIVMAIFFTQYFGFMGCIISLSIGYILQVIAFNFISLKLFTVTNNLN